LGLSKLGNRIERAPFFLMLLGVILFSGSIYLLVLNPLIDYALPEMIGIITPIGGTCLIISWILVFVKILKEKMIYLKSRVQVWIKNEVLTSFLYLILLNL
jgi:uncharacterized membrane protein YgdD (TMEM256/DUF423 family)